MSAKQEIVWSIWVRLSHWLVAIIVLIEWLNETGYWHRLLGYVCTSIVLSRLLYGFASQRETSQFYWPSWLALKQHVQMLLISKVEAHKGHNPLGQLAVYFMWCLIGALALTGWLSRTDAYWGESGPVDAHQLLSDVLMALVVLHVLAVMVMSALSKVFLLKQMITGRKSSFKSTSRTSLEIE